MIKPKKITLEFLGEDVVFTERSARQVFAAVDDTEKGFDQGENYRRAIFMYALTISDCAKPYIDGLPFFKKRNLNRKLSPKNIIREMPPRVISEFTLHLLKELEGLVLDAPVEKKKDQNLSNSPSSSLVV